MFGFFKKMRNEIEALKEKVRMLEESRLPVDESEQANVKQILDEWLNGKEDGNE